MQSTPQQRQREPVKIWSSYDREGWIRDCQYNDKKESSTWNGSTRFDYKAYPKLSPELVINGTELDEYRSQATAALASSMYSSKFRKMPYTFYERVSQEVYSDAFLFKNTRVLVKGSNAYRYHLGGEEGDESEWSDMDLVVYINPDMPISTWLKVKEQVQNIILKNMSLFKRVMDGMFCFNYRNPTQILSQDEIADFRAAYADNLRHIDVPDGRIISPFSNDDDNWVRNRVSRNSFVVTESKTWADHNVKVDVPHFVGCDNLFLPRTPFYLSCNSTIRYKKGDVAGDFDLFRIKVNNMRMFHGSNSWETVPSDFIDISIPNLNDTGLREFWADPRSVSVRDAVTKTWLEIPVVATCVSDLEKMLTCLDCPENKREKREKKLKMLQALLPSKRGDQKD